VDVSDGAVTVEGSDLRVTGEAPGVVRVDGRKAWVAAAGDTRWVYYDGRVHVLEVQHSDAPRRRRRQQESLGAPQPAPGRPIRGTPGTMSRAVTR
jgi:serine/threonine protein phosphatase PrpC